MNAKHESGLPSAAALLRPISPAQPSGVWLRYDPVYRLIEEACREDDHNLPQGIWEQALKRANWPQVEQLCGEALATQSKDLQLAAWLTVAWVHQRGVAGLTDGSRLLCGLAEQFWDDIHPQIEDGDMESRLPPCDWFADQLPLALLSVPLAAGRSAAGQAYTLGAWEAVLRGELHAAQAAKGMRGRDKQPPAEQILRSHFMAAAAATPTLFYQALQADIEAAVAALDQLDQVLHARMGAAAPNFDAIIARLELGYGALQELGGIPAWQEAPPEEIEMADTETADSAPHGSAGAIRSREDGIRSREEAYRMLEQAADYLLRTEPHSPAPYLVKRAVGWGKMPLAELLQELLDNEGDLKQIYRLLGTHGR